MTHVVTEACIRCKYTDCVDVCPVDAFREGPNFLVIDPDLCIDCAVCVPECPVEAILLDEDVPADQQDFIPLNAELSRIWQPITRTRAPLPDADAWAKVSGKRAELRRDVPGSGTAGAPAAEAPAEEASAAGSHAAEASA